MGTNRAQITNSGKKTKLTINATEIHDVISFRYTSSEDGSTYLELKILLDESDIIISKSS